MKLYPTVVIALLLAISCNKEQPLHTAPLTIAANAAAPAPDTTAIIDSLETALDSSFGIPAGGMVSPVIVQGMVLKTNTPQPPVSYQQPSCTHGYYHTNIIQNGTLASGFIGSFKLESNTVSQFDLVLQGMTFGWSWSTGETYYNTGLSGTTMGTATYNYGIVSISFQYAMEWQVLPATCQFAYKLRKMIY